jgi:hypothetical protein
MVQKKSTLCPGGEHKNLDFRMAYVIIAEL